MYLISTVLYPNQSYNLYNWIWNIILENPGIESINLGLQVSMVQNGRYLTPEEKIIFFLILRTGLSWSKFGKWKIEKIEAKKEKKS